MKLNRLTTLLTGILVGGVLVTSLAAQSAAPSSKAALSANRSHYRPARFSRRANLFYSEIWGVDSLDVRTVESGELVRFSYRVIDVNKAKALNDKRIEPSLIDPQAGVSLVVPAVAKVGKLRQTAPPEMGRVYWMTFSNKGGPVKPGHHVDVVIGNFRAEGLVVQ